MQLVLTTVSKIYSMSRRGAQKQKGGGSALQDCSVSSNSRHGAKDHSSGG